MDNTASHTPSPQPAPLRAPARPAWAPPPAPARRAAPSAATVCFFVLVVLQVIAVWTPAWFPSQDGPAHLETAVGLAQWSGSELYRSAFEVNLGPVPNWSTHAVLAALTLVVSPVVAERILVTIYALLFPLAALYFFGGIRPGRRLFALLFVPFVLSINLHMGFYNFCLASALYLLAVGMWWRHRNALTWKTALLLNAILIVAFLSHILPTLLAIGSIGLLALLDTDRGNLRDRLRLLPLLAPSLVLPVWYLVSLTQSKYPGDIPDLTLGTVLGWFVTLESLVTDRQHLWVTVPLAVCFAVLGVAKLVSAARSGAGTLGVVQFGRTPGSAFGVLAAVLFVVYLVSPEATAGGGFIKQRLAVFPFLVLVPAIEHRLGPVARRTLGTVLVLLCLAHLGITLRYYRDGSRDLEEFNSGIERVEAGKTFLNRPFQLTTGTAKPGLFGHAGGYYASAKRGIDLQNYQVATDHFPLRIRPSAGWHPFDPWFVLLPKADYVLLWAMPQSLEPLLDQIPTHEPIFRSAGGRLLVLGRKD